MGCLGNHHAVDRLSCSLPDHLATALHNDLAKIQQVVTSTQPPPLSPLGKELLASLGEQLATELSEGRMAMSDLEPLLQVVGLAAGPAARQQRTPYAAHAQPLPRGQQQQAAMTAAAAAGPAATRERVPPVTPPQPPSQEQQRAAAVAAAAAAAADRMAQLLMVRSVVLSKSVMLAGRPLLTSLHCYSSCAWGLVAWYIISLIMQEEEAAESAAKGAKQARRKAQKSRKSARKAAKTAAPSLADATPDAAAAEQPVDRHAASDSRAQSVAGPASGSDASAGAEARPPAGSEADNSWQLCPLTKVMVTQMISKE